MSRYEPLKIEQKWQERWEKERAFEAQDGADVPKMYATWQFPYPSGAGLHVGHCKGLCITDAVARFQRANGLNVMFPIGWDTFGMPAENYAIKTGVSPQKATKTNIANFKKQLKRLGMSIDWSREINTSDPEYYRWTQWIFKKLYERGLAYRAENYQWWCPVDKTVLANEQAEGGHCWRCGSQVEKKKMKQWFFKITEYAEELLAGLDELDWPEGVKTAQRNWIGKSLGAEVEFEIEGTDEKIKVFTTRVDTLFGATFLVLAPEHPMVGQLVNDDTRQKVDQYRGEAMKKSEIERQENKEKTGVFTGSYAINPATGEKIPIWVADYVLMGYGTGAIMAVPAHDERDFEFAEKFELPIIKVIEKPDSSKDDELCYDGEGEMVNSGHFNGRQSSEAREEIAIWLEQQGIGEKKVIYKMRDWLISRQRYWGAPIPVAYDKSGEAHLIPDEQLPVVLPRIDDYKPDDSGRSALAKDAEFLKVVIDGQEMERETDTMDGFACSSWYLLRYCDPHNDKAAWDPKKVNYWSPVDFYVGGEHSTTHMLYVRFWTMVFRDMGLTDFAEPIGKFLKNGQVLAEDGRKMSKSLGNTIGPLEVIDKGYGADALRTYLLFMVPPEGDAAWSTAGLGGVYRFLNRCWNLAFGEEDGAEVEAQIKPPATEVTKSSTEVARHKTIKKVTEDLHRNSFNTAVAALMEFANELYKNPHSEEDLIALARLLKPFAPHLASEMLEQFGADEVWPEWDEKYLVSDTVEIVVQVNGKLRARAIVASEVASDKEKLEKAVRADEKVKAQLEGKEIIKTIALPKNRLVNFVVKD